MAGIWKVVSDVPGRLRAKNDLLLDNELLRVAIGRALSTAMGVQSSRISQWSCSAVIYYDMARTGKSEVLRILAEAEPERALALVPAKKQLTGARTIALIFVGFGIFGVLVPGIPGWPFLLVAIPLFSAGDPRQSKFDAWLKRKCPNVRRKAFELTIKMLQGGPVNR